MHNLLLEALGTASTLNQGIKFELKDLIHQNNWPVASGTGITSGKLGIAFSNVINKCPELGITKVIPIITSTNKTTVYEKM